MLDHGNGFCVRREAVKGGAVQGGEGLQLIESAFLLEDVGEAGKAYWAR